MNTTRASLLIRIKDPDANEAWSQFHDLYAPLIYRYARRRGLNRHEAEDVRSECYEAIVATLRGSGNFGVFGSGRDAQDLLDLGIGLVRL